MEDSKQKGSVEKQNSDLGVNYCWFTAKERGHIIFCSSTNDLEERKSSTLICRGC